MASGLRNARKYAYAGARANAMKSKLLDRKTLQEIASAKDINTMIAMLFERDYRQEIEEFGGLKIKSNQVDFALSKNLAKNVLKLIRLAQGKDREIMQGIAGKWDLYNIRLAIEAKERRHDFESIAKYVVDAGRYNTAGIREAMREDSTEAMLQKLLINSPYRKILSETLEAYRKTKSAYEAISVLDREYYAYLARISSQLSGADHWSASKILKMEIDMRNILTLIRAKKANIKQGNLAPFLIANGNMGKEELEQIFTGSKDVEEMLSQIKQFDLKDAIEVYKADQHKQLLTFEVALRNAIFVKGVRSLGHAIIAFGTILAYMYMKETEVSTLRILINGRSYGLEKEEIDRLIGWKAS